MIAGHYLSPDDDYISVLIIRENRRACHARGTCKLNWRDIFEHHPFLIPFGCIASPLINAFASGVRRGGSRFETIRLA